MLMYLSTPPPSLILYLSSLYPPLFLRYVFLFLPHLHSRHRFVSLSPEDYGKFLREREERLKEEAAANMEAATGKKK